MATPSFAKACGLEKDLNVANMGVRSSRYSMIVDDGVVKQLNIETQSGVNVSGRKRFWSSCKQPHPAFGHFPRWRTILPSWRSCERDPYLNGLMPSRASSSARSFSGWPSWPFTQCHEISCRLIASSSACHNSTFFTGFLSAVFQPFFFQP